MTKRSIDSPECAHGWPLFSPEPCPVCCGNEAPPVTAAVALDDDLELPEFLDRTLHPELVTPPTSDAAYRQASKGKHLADFRERFPLTEKDKEAIAQIEREQRVVKRDKTAERLKKAGFTK